jgi:hypothetical protein
MWQMMLFLTEQFLQMAKLIVLLWPHYILAP